MRFRHLNLIWQLLFLIGLVGAQDTAAESELVTARPATQTVVLTGFTRARSVLALSSEVAGKVKEVFADVGEAIPADGKFACLDETFIDFEIEDNQAEKARVKVDINYYNKQLNRYRQLVSRNSSAKSQLDEAERNFGGASRRFKQLLGTGKMLRERKDRHCLKAPPGWRVIKRQIEPGQWLDVGGAAADIGDFEKLLIPFALTMNQYRILRETGDRLSIRLTDIDKTVPARIERISPEFDEQSRKIMLDLQISKGLEERRGGLRAELTLNEANQSGAVLVPSDALQKRYEEYWLKRADGSEIQVEYMGRDSAQSLDGVAMVRVMSASIKPGDRFRRYKN